MDIVVLIQEFMKVENPMEFEDCFKQWIDYIKQQFKNRNVLQRERHEYIHVTCAVDKDDLKKVIEDVHHCVILSTLQTSGLI